MNHWPLAGPVPALLMTLTLATPSLARGALVIEAERPSARVTYTASGNKLRIETKGDRPHVTIFDGDAQKLYEIDPLARRYVEMKQPEQRAKPEPKRSTPSASAPVYEATGRKGKIAGHACQRYLIKHDGVAEDACFIPWGSVVKKEDLLPFVSLDAFMDSYAAASFGTGRGRGRFRITEDLERAPGFPAVMKRAEPGKRELEERVVGLKRAKVSPETFQVPADYAKPGRPAANEGSGAPGDGARKP